MFGQGWTDAVKSFKGLVAAHLKAGPALDSYSSNLVFFKDLWGDQTVLMLAR